MNGVSALSPAPRTLIALGIGFGAALALYAGSRVSPDAGYAVVFAAVLLASIFGRGPALATLAACVAGLLFVRLWPFRGPLALGLQDGYRLLLHVLPAWAAVEVVARVRRHQPDPPVPDPDPVSAPGGELLAQLGAVTWEADWQQSLALEQEHLRVRRVSEEVESLTGYAPVRWLAEPDFHLSLVHPEDRMRFLDFCSRVADGEPPGAVEYRLWRADGQFPWVRHLITAAPSGRPGVVVLRGLLLSIAEEKEAEETLRASEEWYRRIVDTASEGLLVLDAELRVAYANRGLGRMLGVRSDRLIGRSCGDLFAAEDAGQAGVFLRSLKPDHTDQRDFRLLKADGTLCWALVSASAIRNDRGASVGALAMVTDVTERRQAEEAVRFLARASSLLGSSLDPRDTFQSVAELAVPHLADWCAIDLVDEAGEMVRVACAGGARQGFPGSTDADGEHPILEVLLGRISRRFTELRPDRRGMIAGSAAPESRAALLVPLQTAERSLGVISLLRSAPTYDAEDLAVAEDLARRAAVALENARLYQEVQRAGEAKDQFLAMLAHELRNPLGAVRNALQVIRQSPEGSAARSRALDVAERQVAHQVRMVDDLLDVSRIHRGKIDLQWTRVDLGRVVADTVQDIASAFAESGVRLQAAVSREDCLELEGDPTRLAQVVTNLLQNALKFTDPGGTVWVRLCREGGEAVLSVTDSGIGIDPEMLPRVFETFTQADQSLARTRGGLGLGLALVQGLVDLHGGRVEARSAGSGLGAQFTVRLPLMETSMADLHPNPAGEAAPADGEESRRVLVVEDLPDAAETLRDLLELAGHEVFLASDGEQGVEAVRQHHPDVVLCDIGLPVIDGYEVARRVRREHNGRRPYLVALTGYGQPSDRARALEAGFDQHVTKPVRPDDLLRMIRR